MSIDTDGRVSRAYTSGDWNGQAKVSLSLENNGKRLGMVQLGARRGGSEYTAKDAKTLQENIRLVAAAMALALRTKGLASLAASRVDESQGS